jgi:hypothetical protein
MRHPGFRHVFVVLLVNDPGTVRNIDDAALD